ncbi:hypothetical protein ACFLVX_05060, partial [Chloroflexota bacterium]
GGYSITNFNVNCSDLLKGYYRAPKWGLTAKYHVYILSDKVMKVWILHCELKWEMSATIATPERAYS